MFRRSEMSDIQGILYETYFEVWRQRYKAEAAVDETLHRLGELRKDRDRAQTKLERLFALLQEHGVSENVERLWPVAPNPERADDETAAVADIAAA